MTQVHVTEPDEDPRRESRGHRDRGRSFREPTTAAFIAFPLAVWGLSGIDSLWGLHNLLELSGFLNRHGNDREEWFPLLSALFSMAFATGVHLFARGGLARATDAEPWWLHALLRAAMAITAHRGASARHRRGPGSRRPDPRCAVGLVSGT